MHMRVGMAAAESLQAVTDGYRMPNPQNSQIECPAELYDMMLQCWDEEPNDRPSFAQLRDFFNKFCADLDTIYQLDDDAE